MKHYILLSTFMVFFTGCVTTFTPVSNNTDLSKVDFSKVDKMKSGKACSTWYFIFGPFGGQSLVEAAKQGGLSRVEVVDYRQEGNFLVTSLCTVAYGQ